MAVADGLGGGVAARLDSALDAGPALAWLRLVPVSLGLLLVVGFLKVYEVGI